jgi:pimeloyl-ACP methyl ester carboxylesterase
MDDVGSQRAAVFGSSEGGALSVLFTTTYPERVSALGLYGACPRMAWAPDYPDGIPEELRAWAEQLIEENWGRGQEGGLPLYALTPERADDPAWRKAHGRGSANSWTTQCLPSRRFGAAARDEFPVARGCRAA